MPAKRTLGIDDLKSDPRNVRVHDERNQEAVGRSLDVYGAGRSIVVDRDGIAIGGSTVLEQARARGMKARVVQTEGDELVVVQRMDLTADSPRRRGLAIADNRTADLSEFDPERLTQELRELGELGEEALSPDSTGFALDEISQLLAAYPVAQDDDPGDDPEPGEGPSGGGGDGAGGNDGGEKGPKNRRDPAEPRVVTCPNCSYRFELPEGR